MSGWQDVGHPPLDPSTPLRVSGPPLGDHPRMASASLMSFSLRPIEGEGTGHPTPHRGMDSRSAKSRLSARRTCSRLGGRNDGAGGVGDEGGGGFSQGLFPVYPRGANLPLKEEVCLAGYPDKRWVGCRWDG